MGISRDTLKVASRLSVAAGLAVAVCGAAAGGNLKRLSAEFQNSSSVEGSGEISTNTAAGAGGTGGLVVYSKTLKVPEEVDVLYVTFSGQGDAHQGSALLMTATVNGTLVEPLAGQTAGGGSGPHVQTGWYTLVHLPAANTGTNCNDGGGGTADCHDNTINFTGCARIVATDEDKSTHEDKSTDEHKSTHEDKSTGEHKSTHEDKFTATVEIKLANLPGGGNNYSFYERASIYIDGQSDEGRQLCKGAAGPALF
jgi:hypothetical protein